MKMYRSYARMFFFLFLFPGLLASGQTGFAQEGTWPQVFLTPVQTELSSPVHVTHAGDGSGRLFIVEQDGRILIRENGALLATPFLNLGGPNGKISCCGERGLLSVAFPLDYAAKQYFYVYYTDTNGDLAVARYHVSANPDIADANSEEIILSIPHPTYGNHNGGQLAFSPNDGYLYIGPGDGGSGGDPDQNAQNGLSLLGKILRIDVESGASPYAIPPSNPFVGNASYRPEIWALGVRNPWRFSFDRHTGDLYIADVGQGSYEEINFQAASSPGGENYGWRCREGLHDYNGHSNECAGRALTDPVTEYGHGAGCSVTGGFVYRGSQYTALSGIYFYGDFCSGSIYGLRRSGDSWEDELLLPSGLSIASFGEDESGELYIADISGSIYKVTSTPSTPQVDLTGDWSIVQERCRTFQSGQRCTVSGLFWLKNLGTKRATHATFTRFYLSTDPTLSPDDVELRSKLSGRIRAGSIRNLTMRRTLPLGDTAHDRYVIAVVDADNTIVETEERNNGKVFGPVP